MKHTLVILAAGMGSRYGGLKQIDPVGPSGELIIDYSVHDALKAGFGKLVFVIRESIAGDFKTAIGARFEDRIEVAYAFQDLAQLPHGVSLPPDREKPWGTGHAVLAAADAVETPFAVINADDFYGQSSYVKLAEFLSTAGTTPQPEYALVAFTLRKTLSDHGHVARGVCTCNAQGSLCNVVELTHIERSGNAAVNTADDGTIIELTGDEPVSMNLWGFDVSIFENLRSLFREFLDENIDKPKAEFFLPAAVDTLIARDRATCRVLHTNEQWAGVTYQKDRPAIAAFIKDQVESGRYSLPLWS